MVEEHEFTCPYCWQPISMVLDLSTSIQDYVEDCEVCCRPMDIKVRVPAPGSLQIDVRREND